jgi:3-hydroxy-9,10-secoandrosta-1,3,5(10)-triene-9,17-dione monooxygenase reductase component
MTKKNALPAAGLRRVLGHLPTGVVVLAAEVDSRPVGMACNSFTSVSLDPPLVSFSVAHASSTWPRLRRSGRFCANILASHHDELSRIFSRRGADRWLDVARHRRWGGPGLDDAVAWIDCEIANEYEAGDHVIVVSAVAEIEVHEDGHDPLLFFRGEYGSFGPSDEGGDGRLSSRP